MKGSAAILEQRYVAFEFSPVEFSTCLPHEVLVELAATGICHTDLGVRAGDIPIPPLPAILGHEGSGIVLETGSDVRNVEVGDHVVLTFGSCGTCPECLSGHRARCRNFIVANMRGCRPDGSHVHSRGDRPIHGSFFGQSSFATHAVVPALNAVKVRRDVPIELLGPLGCGMQTGAGTVLNHLRPEPGASLCIFGVGAVGLAAVMGARIADCGRIVAVDLHADRLKLALELGATDALDASDPKLAEKLRSLLPGGFDHVIDTSGAPPAITAALSSIRFGGTISLLAIPRNGAEITVAVASLMTGTMSAVTEGDSRPDEFIPLLIEHYLAGRFPFDRLVTRYEFSDIDSAVADLEAGRVIKPILRIKRGD